MTRFRLFTCALWRTALPGLFRGRRRRRGAAGSPGTARRAGYAGHSGRARTAGAGVTWRGDWSCGSYAARDVVSHQGASWVARDPIEGCRQPPDSPWQLVADKGADGPAGPAGPPGPGDLRARKAALLQWYRQDFPVGPLPQGIAFDGANVWVANSGSGSLTKY